jgi:WD40 repeat protein/serine/threonine protein kinase
MLQKGNRAGDPHLEKLIEQLSAIDEGEMPDPTLEQTDLDQLWNLRRELESISNQLRTAPPADPLWNEPQCQQILKAILTLPHRLQKPAERADTSDPVDRLSDPHLADHLDNERSGVTRARRASEGSSQQSSHQDQAGCGESGENPVKVTNQFMSASSQGRFRILRPHAKGGLGQVSVALDQELNREVALKEIQSQHADDHLSRERFVLEAEITGGLEHPGIVPVYALGQGTDGHPFYAMRFVQGDSLKQVIEDFHEPDNPNRLDSGARQLALRQLLGRFINVCNAIEYAHSRGILHRDLKPANIMLGKYGETLVVDWGLAKPMGNPECLSYDSKSSLAIAFSNSGQTQPGSVIGTPGYMSPEQAAGNLDQFGPATDVYSLGATLYHLLTGQAPMVAQPRRTSATRSPIPQERSLPEILQGVQQGDFPKPREVDLLVPRALEAVCLKAMALRPEDRYASASAIAADIEHWLADEPIAAYRETRVDKAARWIRRHRAWALSGASAVVLVAIVATVAAFLINGQKLLIAEKERDSQELADRNATLAEEKSTLSEQEKGARENADRHADAALQQTKLAERHLYVAHMNLAQSAWESSHVDQTVRLLNLYRPAVGPKVGADDLRGFEWYYLNHCCHSDLSTLVGHTGFVLGVAYSLDGMRLASASADHCVKIWDTVTGRELLTLAGHTQSVSGVAFSPGRQQLASASVDNTVKVWDAETGETLFTLEGRHGPALGMTFSPDGQKLACGGNDGTVTLWDITTRLESSTLKGHQGPVSTVAFSSDGKRLASGGYDHSIRISDVATGRTLQTMNAHNQIVFSVAFSPDGQRLASASYDEFLTVWDTVTGHELLTLKGHTHPVLSVAFSPDGRRLVSAGVDQTIRLWDAATGRPLDTLKGHTQEIKSVVFSPDGSQIASASMDRTVKLWDVRTVSESLVPFSDAQGAATVAFSPDGERLASGSYQAIQIWHAYTGWVSLRLTGHTGSVRAVAFSPDGQRLASASDDHTVKLWDVATGHELLTLLGHTERVWSVVFSPDGQQLASSSDDLTLKLWDAAIGQTQFTLKGHTGSVSSVRFSRDGKRLVSASADRTAKVWDAATGEELLTLRGHALWVRDAAFSPDGRQLATSSEDLTVKLWDAATGEESLTLNGHALSVTSLSFSPDGTRLASASHDKTVKLWDLASGQESLTLKGHTDAVSAVAFSPDGLRLATASWHDTVRIWNALPWTPELKNEQQSLRMLQQALGMLRLSCTQPMNLEALTEKIQHQPAISDGVRRRALELAETYLKQNEQFVNKSPIRFEVRNEPSLLLNGSFEVQTGNTVWTPHSWRQNAHAAAIKAGIAYTGKSAALLATDVVDDVRLCQDVVVQPNTDYLLCGWVKTEGVELKQEGKIGANLCLFGSFQEHSHSVKGDRDWTRLTLNFNSGQRTSVKACVRLGYQNSTCIGKAWFDDLCLIPLKGDRP